MTFIFDGAEMTDRAIIHDTLAQALRFPEYYGRNLDALYDLLTAYPEPLTVILRNKSRLGEYGLRTLDTIIDAAKNNPRIKFEEKDC